MGLTRYVIAFGLGYALGDPNGRRNLVALRGKATELTRRPEVKQVRERAWDVAGDTVLATRNRLAQRSRGTAGADEPRRRWRRPRFGAGSGAAGDAAAAPAVTELPGTTVAEDSEAAILGRPVPPRASQQASQQSSDDVRQQGPAEQRSS